MAGKPGDFTPYTSAERSKRTRERSAAMLPPIPLDQPTADALARLIDRTGLSRAALVRRLIVAADLDADPFG